MDAVITALTGVGGLSATSFFDVFTDMVPWLAIIVPVSLGLSVLRKAIKGAGKGKVRI